ncbi:response regulator [Beijerinckia indica]|uniref:Response regulator receiver protein n=1 Tax=Beijerinckia indica subsp. indica (strain ATCC 9039 / DSM 1715 / NCIMB 8712) TaxID=395963 RepID=B2IET1_BEII9|nr:response regulator [Beijerinckia indica]ACB94125.1 response regulator receiver protein [Beijerinckia indica subsp. indica ATCC 9039]
MQIGVDNDRRVENKRVFVIDNDGVTGSILQFMLEDHNETHEFASVQEAFDSSEKVVYGKTEKSVPNLLIVGVNILEEKGPDVLKEISAKFPEAKIVVLADNAENEFAKQALAKGGGAHGILTKPLTVEVVRRKVDMLLGRLKSEFVQLTDFSF